LAIDGRSRIRAGGEQELDDAGIPSQAALKSGDGLPRFGGSGAAPASSNALTSAASSSAAWSSAV
jgi:hypothetical protein